MLRHVWFWILQGRHLGVCEYLEDISKSKSFHSGSWVNIFWLIKTLKGHLVDMSLLSGLGIMDSDNNIFSWYIMNTFFVIMNTTLTMNAKQIYVINIIVE